MFRLFYTDEDKLGYLVYWDSGYIQGINEWKQFIPKKGIRYNWINFTPIKLEFEYNKFFMRYFTAEITILGLGLYFHQSLATLEEKMKMDKDFEFFEEEMSAQRDAFDLIREIAYGDEPVITCSQLGQAQDIAETLDKARARARDASDAQA